MILGLIGIEIVIAGTVYAFCGMVNGWPVDQVKYPYMMYAIGIALCIISAFL